MKPETISVDEYKRRYVDYPRVQQPTRGKMNGTEASYAQHLELLKRAGEIRAYHYEALTLRLAKRTSYTPDFVVVAADGSIELHECKGFWRDDARCKIKVAAELFPYFTFLGVTKGRGGMWRYEAFP